MSSEFNLFLISSRKISYFCKFRHFGAFLLFAALLFLLNPAKSLFAGRGYDPQFEVREMPQIEMLPKETDAIF